MKTSTQIRRKPVTKQMIPAAKKEDANGTKAKKPNDAVLKPKLTTTNNNNDIKPRKGPTKATEPAKNENVTRLSRTKPPAKPDFKINKIAVPTQPEITSGPSKVNSNAQQPPRVRTQTRTLKPEEVVVLKNVAQDRVKIPNDLHKAPVSFEVDITKAKSNTLTSIKKPLTEISIEKCNETDGEDHYESEFESYESDFECGSSSSNNSSNSDSSSEPSDSDQSSTLDNAKECEVNEDRKTMEQKLDSGHYEIKVKKVETLSENVPSSIIKSDDNQPDSGMNSGQYEGLCYIKLLQNRYTDILNKITLNIMTYDLYEEKPASYENFLQNYTTAFNGVLNHTQTESEAVTSEAQTSEVYQRSCWIQYPPQFSKNTLTNMDYNHTYHEEKNGFGIDHYMETNSTSTAKCVFSQLISKLQNKTELSSSPQQKRPLTNPIQLHKFLHRSCTLVEMAISKKRKKSSPQPRINMVCFRSENQLLQNSVVTLVRCDSNSSHVVLSLHECHLLQQEQKEYSICVWDMRRCTYPQIILSSWENITCIEKVGPIVIAGTINGALCLWHTERTDERNCAFQLITPTIRKTDLKHYGVIISIKTLQQTNNLKSVIVDQILTLFDTGILITWMLSPKERNAFSDMDQHNLNIIFHVGEHCLSQKYVLDLANLVHNPKSSLKDTHPNLWTISREHILTSHSISGDMIVYRNNVIVAINSHLLIVNHLEQKCSTILNIRDPTMTFMKHPTIKELMLAHSMNNTVQILRIVHDEYETWQRKRIHRKTPPQGSNVEKSPIPSNKSCAIQNIVLNHNGRNRGDNQAHSPGTTFNDSNLHKNSLEPTETGSMYHNQIIFLKHVPPRYRSLFFLDQARILCADTENSIRLTDMKNKGEIKLNERITSELNKYRLLGMTQTQAIMTVDDQILLYDLTDHMGVP